MIWKTVWLNSSNLSEVVSSMSDDMTLTLTHWRIDGWNRWMDKGLVDIAWRRLESRSRHFDRWRHFPLFVCSQRDYWQEDLDVHVLHSTTVFVPTSVSLSSLTTRACRVQQSGCVTDENQQTPMADNTVLKTMQSTICDKHYPHKKMSVFSLKIYDLVWTTLSTLTHLIQIFTLWLSLVYIGALIFL